MGRSQDPVDFGRTAQDYGRYRRGFPDELVDVLLWLGVDIEDSDVLDLGTGTGSLARLFALAGARVTGLDPSEDLLATARDIDRQEGVAVTYVRGVAEDTGLGGECFDIVSAGQCWHWFDGPAAAREVFRLLKPGGLAVISHFDWVPIDGNVVVQTESLIERHNPSWRLGGGTGIYPEWMRELGNAGLIAARTASFDLDVEYSHENWIGRVRASAGVGASLSDAEVCRFESEMRALLVAEFPDLLSVLHRCWTVVASRPT